MEALASGAGVVGNFVLFKTRSREHIHGRLKKFRILLHFLHKFSAGEPLEIFRVLFVSEAVGGNMIGGQFDGPQKGFPPVGRGLTGDSEDEVQVDIFGPGLPEDFITPPGLGCRVNTAQGFEEPLIPRLHAHADAVHPEGEKG